MPAMSRRATKGRSAPTVQETPEREEGPLAATLLDVALVASSFRIEPEYFDTLEGPDGSPSHELSLHVLVDPPRFDPAAGMAVAAFEWVISARDGTSELFQVSATYAVSFGDLTDAERGGVVELVEREGAFASFPYFRAFAAQIGWASGAELPPLPILTDDTFRLQRARAAEVAGKAAEKPSREKGKKKGKKR
jgi:hypothetical protein